jgi:hypothetical protein
MRHIVVFALLLALFFPAASAGAQERGVVPGDMCPVSDLNKVFQDGGPATGGSVHLLVCDGYHWQTLSTWRMVNKTAHFGIGTVNPHEALEVNGNIAMTGANATLKDVGGYLGFAFKNVTVMAIANIIQILAPMRIDNYLSFNPGAYALFPGGIWDAKGRIGLNTLTPKTLLDVNGIMKLKLNDKQPVACGPDYQGAIAMTREARMCACNSANAWVDLNSSAVCIW